MMVLFRRLYRHTRVAMAFYGNPYLSRFLSRPAFGHKDYFKVLASQRALKAQSYHHRRTNPRNLRPDENNNLPWPSSTVSAGSTNSSRTSILLLKLVRSPAKIDRMSLIFAMMGLVVGLALPPVPPPSSLLPSSPSLSSSLSPSSSALSTFE